MKMQPDGGHMEFKGSIDLPQLKDITFYLQLIHSVRSRLMSIKFKVATYSQCSHRRFHRRH